MGHLRKGGDIFYEIENNLEPAEKIWVQNMEKKTVTQTGIRKEKGEKETN